MPPAANRELLVHRYAVLRDAGQSACAEGRAMKAALVSAYGPELRRLARSWARSAPNASYDVDDLLQEGVIVLLTVLEAFNPHAITKAGHPPRFADFLGVSVRNLLWKNQRHDKRHAPRASNLDDYLPHARIDGARMYAVPLAFP